MTGRSGERGWTTILAPGERVEIVELPIPGPAPGDLLVRMERANVCGSDIHILHGRHPLLVPGHCMGHEGVGVVDRLGAGVVTDSAGAPLGVGDRVTFTYLVSCGRCRQCQRGLENFCAEGFDHWCSPAERAPHFKGTFGSHYYLTARQRVYRIPDSVPGPAAASANCALAQMVNAVGRSQVGPGDSLLILGAGGLGLCGAAVAAETGARVVVADRAPGKAAAALDFGADEVLDLSAADDADALLATAGTDGGPADAVIDVTGSPPAFLSALAATRVGGRMLSVGTVMPSGTVDFDPAAFTRTGVTIEAVIRYRPQLLGAAVSFLTRNPDLPWSSLVDRELPGREVQAALTAAAEGRATRVSLLMEA